MDGSDQSTGCREELVETANEGLNVLNKLLAGNTNEAVEITRRELLKGAGASAATACAPWSSSRNITELPVEVYPVPSDIDLEKFYRDSLEAPPSYDAKMAGASHDEIDTTGLQNIANQFNNRTDQIKNVAAAAGAQYRQERPSSAAMVKAVHDTLPWYTFENGCRADNETLFENNPFPGTVLTYPDQNQTLQRKLMISKANVTRPSDMTGDYSETGFMDSQNDLQLAAMDFNVYRVAIQEKGIEVPDSGYFRNNKGVDDFLYGNRFDDANLVFTSDAGLAIADKLKKDPETARGIKDEVNMAYNWTDQEYGLDQKFLKVGLDESQDDFKYELVTPETAKGLMIKDY